MTPPDNPTNAQIEAAAQIADAEADYLNRLPRNGCPNAENIYRVKADTARSIAGKIRALEAARPSCARDDVELIAAALWASGGYILGAYNDAPETPLKERHRQMARDAIAALSSPIAGDGLRALPASVLSFILAIQDRTPNGEWIKVQYHPDGDWSVANSPEAPIAGDDDRLFAVLVEGLHDQIFGTYSLGSPELSHAALADDGNIHEAAHALVRALPPRRAKVLEEWEAKVTAYDQAHYDAVELGYPSLAEALKALPKSPENTK
jgi:hypothetical protein